MANEELPEWARITSDLVDDGGEQNGEVAPSAPTAAPSQPESAAPVPVSPVPVPPVPVESVDAAPVPLPPVTPARPGRREPSSGAASAVPVPEVVPLADSSVASEGEVRRRPPRDEEVERHYDDTPFEDPAADVVSVAATPPEPSVVPQAPPRKMKTFTGRKKVEARPPTINKHDGRKKTLVLRLIVWVVIGIVAVAGLRAIVAPPSVNTAAISASIAETYGLETFPVDRGLAVATAFARDYLTLRPGESQAREARLQPLVTPNLIEAPWLRNDEKVNQVIAQGPYLLREPTVAGEQRATYIMAASVIDPVKAEAARKDGQILNPSWVYLSVPIYWAANGGLAVAGPPGFVPGPIAADEQGGFSYPTDEEAARSLAVDLDGFFRAWGASSQDDLARYTPTDAAPAVRAGLGGTVRFVELGPIEVERVESPTAMRFAQVTVVWNYQGGELRQGYRLEVFQDTEGRWYVQDITGGDYQ